MSLVARMFGILMRARFRMLRNIANAAPRLHKVIIASLVLFGAAIFAGVGVGCAALLMIMQGNTPVSAGLTPPATALVGHVYQYLFFFLLAGSVPYVASSIFQDNDLPLLLTTPIPPPAVIAAKMLDAIAANSSQFLVLGVPVLIGLGWGVGLSPAGWAWSLSGLALLLVLTPALSGCMLLILAKVFGMRRVRFVVMAVSVILALGITLLAVAGAARATEGGTMDFRHMQQVLSQSSTRASDIKAALTHSLHGAAPTDTRLRLSTAGVPLLPSTWCADIVLSVAGGMPIGAVGKTALGILLTAAALLLAGCVIIGGRVVVSETILEQQDLESFGRKSIHHGSRGGLLSKLPGVPMNVFGLLVKDLRYVGRDTILLGQIGTTLILFLVPFVLKLTAQPDDGSSNDTYGALARLMIALIVFMVTSIIGLSSVGLEGKGVWLVLGSPIARKQFLRAKWILSFTLSLAIVTVLTAIAALSFEWSLGASIQWLGILGCACYALSGLGVGLGGLFPRFLFDNPAHRASIWAMILGFVFSTVYIVLSGVTFVIVWVVYIHGDPQAAEVAMGGVCVFTMLTIITGSFPVRLAEQRLLHYEWEQ